MSASTITPQHEIAGAPIPFRDRITCSVKDALDASGIGTTKLYALLKTGELESTKVGDRRLIKVRSLLRLLGEDAAQ